MRRQTRSQGLPQEELLDSVLPSTSVALASPQARAPPSPQTKRRLSRKTSSNLWDPPELVEPEDETAEEGSDDDSDSPLPRRSLRLRQRAQAAQPLPVEVAEFEGPEAEEAAKDAGPVASEQLSGKASPGSGSRLKRPRLASRPQDEGVNVLKVLKQNTERARQQSPKAVEQDLRLQIDAALQRRVAEIFRGALSVSAGKVSSATLAATSQGLAGALEAVSQSERDFKTRARSLSFNLRDNQDLRQSILSGKKALDEVVRAPSWDLARKELQEERKQERDKYFREEIVGAGDHGIGWKMPAVSDGTAAAIVLAEASDAQAPKQSRQGPVPKKRTSPRKRSPGAMSSARQLD
mmetsp:Transcript_16238/g.28372  ORF Transcript_16238/g.28372 Transcript_16238/m.28372 type:complete len:351 (+) Transcript_16238:62-1114(+)